MGKGESGEEGGRGGGYSHVCRKLCTLTVLPLLDSCCSTRAQQPQVHPFCSILWVVGSFQSYSQMKRNMSLKDSNNMPENSVVNWYEGFLHIYR